jgi:hypothetical protein
VAVLAHAGQHVTQEVRVVVLPGGLLVRVVAGPQRSTLVAAELTPTVQHRHGSTLWHEVW